MNVIFDAITLGDYMFVSLILSTAQNILGTSLFRADRCMKKHGDFSLDFGVTKENIHEAMSVTE